MFVDIAIPRTRLDFLTYESKEKLAVGDLVTVPLRQKKVFGIVVKVDSDMRPRPIKQVAELNVSNFIIPPLIEFYSWLGRYYQASLGEVLTLALPKNIFGLIKKSKAEKGAVSVKGRPPDLTPDQHRIVQRILRAETTCQLKPFLLFGITGSGKTEIYLRVIENIIRHGKKALVMVPEISMTPLLLNRFLDRFGQGVVAMHSSLPAAQRKKIWHEIRGGRYDVVIGPRSCLFLPIPDLRIIVIDEEHDTSYKEEARHPRYNSRDAAVMRAKIEGSLIILGSATPSIESYQNAMSGKYDLLTLGERIDARPLPKVQVVDLKKEQNRFITQLLREKLKETLARKEQVIIFLNRRGYAPVLLCPICGYVAKCPYCYLPLVYHKQEDCVACHYCSYRKKIPDSCPDCHREDFVYKGLGTQKLEIILQQYITPDEILRLDRDSARLKGKVENILMAFEANRARILMGTQLVTKGFDFPNVTLIGIINADNLFHFPDFRAGERTFQLLTQVAGRAGRGDKPGEVIIQTYYPNQLAIECARTQNFSNFYKEEIKIREALFLPPFARLIHLRFSGREEKRVKTASEAIAARFKQWPAVTSYGPKPSFHYRLRDIFRYFILIKVAKEFPVEEFKFLKEWQTKGVRIEVDVDPQEVI